MIMGAHPTELVTHGRSAIGTIRWIGLFVVAWALFALAGPRPESTRSADSYGVAPASTAVIVSPSTASRPLLTPVGNLAPPPIRLVVLQPARPGLVRSAERRDPPPSLFDRVSYRTTAPPSKNG